MGRQQSNIEEKAKQKNYKMETFQSHNIFFSKLSQFIQLIKSLKGDDKLQNEQTKPYISQDTNVDIKIKQLEEYLSVNQEHFQPTNFNLFKVYSHMTGPTLLLGFFYTIGYEILSVSGIYLLDYATDQLTIYAGAFRDKLYISIILLGIVANYVVKNLSFVQYEWVSFRWQALCKTTLQYLVYKKSLKIKNFCKKGNSTETEEDEEGQEESQEKDNEDQGEDEEPISFEKNNPDINNILTVDIEESMSLFTGINQTIGSIVVIIITLFFIYYRIGNSIIYGLLMLAGGMIFITFLGYFMDKFYDKIYSIKDERISLTKDVIEGMKSIKYLGWERIFSKKIMDIRKKEFKQISFMRALDGFQTTFFMSISYLLLYAFIVSYVNEGHDLRSSNVFTIIALFGNLINPMGLIPQALASLAKSRISYKRIKNFLNLEEIKESEVDGRQQIRSTHKHNSYSKMSIVINELSFQWPNKEVEQEEDEEEDQEQEKLNVKEQRQRRQSNETPEIGNQLLSQNSEESDDQSITKSTKEIDSSIFQLNVKDLKIKKGSLNFLICLIGSGKTALILAILNEMDKQQSNNENNSDVEIEDDIKMISFDNKIVVNGSIGYVSQNHWLQTKTVRDNILFGQPYNEKLYNQCLEMCALKEDLSQFYKGDQKVISSDGNNLSGGQRQRISLCRALYQDKDIYLLDDIFSSLDAHVAEYIYNHAIIDYLIKEKKKTVLFATSHYDYLKKSTSSNIIYLKNGSIISDKLEISNYLKMNSQLDRDNQKQLVNEFSTSESKSNLNINDNPMNWNHQNPKSFDYSIEQGEKVDLLKQPQDKDENNEDGVEDDEELREKGNIKFETFKTYFKSQGLVVLFFYLFLFVLVEASSLFIDFWLRDKLTYQNEQDSDFYFVNQLFSSFQSTFLFLTLLQLFITILTAVMYVSAALFSGYRLFNRLNNAIMYSKMVFFDRNPVGRIINRVSDDVNTVDDDLPSSFEIMIEVLVYAIGYPVGIIIQFPWMSVFFIISFMVSFAVTNMYREANREVKRLNSVNKGQLLNHISESCKVIVTVRSMKKQQYMTELYISRLVNNINSYLLSLSMEMWMFVRLLLISNGAQFLVVLATIIFIVFDVNFNQNAVLLCLTYSILFTQQVCEVVNFLCATEENMISVERISQYFDNQQENLTEVTSQKPITPQKYGGNLTIKQQPTEFSIVFKDLYITYDELNSENSEQVQYALKNFNLKIKKGEKIAFCGRTGSGKTSVLNCLYRLYEYQKGTISIDSRDIQSLSLQDLREKMAIIPQFGFLYNASLRDNIDPIQEKSVEEIEKMISSISQQDELEEENEANYGNCFKKLDFEIQESGKNLSNGQKQIINFIRVALRSTDIICLDEATSNMDPKTDELIHEKLFELSRGKTLLVITHRLENIEKYDRIVVLDGGQIMEVGNYKELVKIKNGFFNRLLEKKLPIN